MTIDYPYSSCECGEWLKYGNKAAGCLCPVAKPDDLQHRCPICLAVSATIVKTTGTEACQKCFDRYLSGSET
jgi:hypothetical protein